MVSADYSERCINCAPGYANDEQNRCRLCPGHLVILDGDIAILANWWGGGVGWGIGVKG